MTQPDRLIDGKAADKITGTSRSRRYQLMKCGEYPGQSRTGKLTKFSERECFEFVQRKLDARTK